MRSFRAGQTDRCRSTNTDLDVGPTVDVIAGVTRQRAISFHQKGIDTNAGSAWPANGDASHAYGTSRRSTCIDAASMHTPADGELVVHFLGSESGQECLEADAWTPGCQLAEDAIGSSSSNGGHSRWEKRGSHELKAQLEQTSVLGGPPTRAASCP